MNKKIIYSLGAASLMLLGACSQDDLGTSYVPEGGEANVAVSLSVPKGLQSRAYSDGSTATNLQYALYEVKDDGTLAIFSDMTETTHAFNMSETMNFKLVSGHKYAFVFWAASTEAPYTVSFTDAGATMTVDYTSIEANDETLDAFYAYKEVAVSGDTQLDVPLYRPFAQINVGTSDLLESSELGYTPATSQLVVTGVYDTLDLVSGEVSNAAQRTYAFATLPEGETFPVSGYDYMAMTYALVGDEQELVTVSLQYAAEAETPGQTRDIYNVPVRRNYRTNIYGQILTDNVTLNVEIEPAFNTPDLEPDAISLFLALGGTLVLDDDITIEKGRYVITKDGIIDFNGNTIFSSDGGAESDGALLVLGDAHLTLRGEGGMTTRGDYASILVWADNGGTVTIEGGRYKATNDGEVIYIGEGGGTIYIKGGYFEASVDGSAILNCKDSAYRNGTAKFIVTGGIFEEFDPSDSKGENPRGNFVAPGYKSVPVEINGKNCYMVVPEETGAIVATADDLISAMQEGEDILLAADIDIEASTDRGYGAPAGIKVNGNVFDGAGNTINVTGESGATNSSIINIVSGTVKNVTIKGEDMFKGILCGELKGDVYLENVIENPDFGGMYGINVNDGGHHYVQIKDCVLRGWCSWAATTNPRVDVINTYFGIGGIGGTVYNGLVKPHGNTVFDGCSFDADIYMDLSDFAKNDGTTITFRNCTVDGVKLTKENHKIMRGFELDGLSDWEDYDKVVDRLIFE